MTVGTACAFTGHRPVRFSFGYDEEDEKCLRLKLVLARQISALIEGGVSLFYKGMSLGTDQWCAGIVLDMKRQYANIRLTAVLPCETQANKWSPEHTVRYAREKKREIIVIRPDTLEVVSAVVFEALERQKQLQIFPA